MQGKATPRPQAGAAMGACCQCTKYLVYSGLDDARAKEVLSLEKV